MTEEFKTAFKRWACHIQSLAIGYDTDELAALIKAVDNLPSRPVLSLDEDQIAKIRKYSADHPVRRLFASLDCVGTDGAKVTTETVKP